MAANNITDDDDDEEDEYLYYLLAGHSLSESDPMDDGEWTAIPNGRIDGGPPIYMFFRRRKYIVQQQ